MWWNLVRFVQHRLVVYFGGPTSLYLDPGEHPHCLHTLGGTLGSLETVVLTHKELNCYLQNKTEACNHDRKINVKLCDLLHLTEGCESHLFCCSVLLFFWFF